MTTTAWWVGWMMPLPIRSKFELHAPHWCSGWATDTDGNFTLMTMVGAVFADDAEAAKAKIVAGYDDPTDVEWRWEPYPLDRDVFSDRFPQAEWMAWDSTTGVSCRCGLPTCDGLGR